MEGTFRQGTLSYVSLGDGSVNNAHFLSALNLADMSQHRGFKCPVLFAVSDNGLCISLRGYEWLPRFVDRRMHGMPSFVADGGDVLDVYSKASEAASYVRDKQRPAVLVMTGLSRRFGHAESLLPCGSTQSSTNNR